ncbi:MAG: hypothetical protein QMD44_06445 [Thermodesulfovibrionales bacterium]|jgi:hypothetical protein|nr:hypothetical protein [Thermodesulfovibrionales bacterium]
MVRIVTQILMGLMLLFGVVTLTPKMLFHFRNKNMPRALYFLLIWLISLSFSVAAFYYAYAGLTE